MVGTSLRMQGRASRLRPALAQAEDSQGRVEDLQVLQVSAGRSGGSSSSGNQTRVSNSLAGTKVPSAGTGASAP